MKSWISCIGVVALFFAFDVDSDSRVRLILSHDISKLSSQDLWSQGSASNFGNVSSFDLRGIHERRWGRWDLDIHGTATGSYYSPALPFLSSSSGSASLSQQRWEVFKDIAKNDNYSVSVHVDWLRLAYRTEHWRIRIGRQPVSWGQGILYNPLDVFNAHPPTTLNREFKRGNDSLLVERLFGTGIELQYLGIVRNKGGASGAETWTQAAKAYLPFGDYEASLIVGKHYGDQILGTSIAFPIARSLVRLDLLRRCDKQSNCHQSGVINADYSFEVAGGILYAFAEYFHNGVGSSSLEDGFSALPASLVTGIERGEVHAYGRNLLVFGSNFTWHPLWSQTLALFRSLEDSSMMLYTYLNYVPTDDLSVSFGIRLPFAGRNEEFGELALNDTTTQGGNAGLFFQLSYYR